MCLLGVSCSRLHRFGLLVVAPARVQRVRDEVSQDLRSPCFRFCKSADLSSWRVRLQQPCRRRGPIECGNALGAWLDSHLRAADWFSGTPVAKGKSRGTKPLLEHHISGVKQKLVLTPALKSNGQPLERSQVPQVRGPQGQVFVPGVEIPRIWGPGIARPILPSILTTTAYHPERSALGASIRNANAGKRPGWGSRGICFCPLLYVKECTPAEAVTE